MPCIHIRSRCYGKIKESMEDIHSKLDVLCPKCKRMVHPEEWTSSVPLASLVHFTDITVTEQNSEVIDWIIQWSEQEVRKCPPNPVKKNTPSRSQTPGKSGTPTGNN